MKTRIYQLFSVGLTSLAICAVLTSCNDFLDEHVPQGTLSDEQVKTPKNAEAMVVSAYEAAAAPATVTCFTSLKCSRAC